MPLGAPIHWQFFRLHDSRRSSQTPFCLETLTKVLIYVNLVFSGIRSSLTNCITRIFILYLSTHERLVK